MTDRQIKEQHTPVPCTHTPARPARGCSSPKCHTSCLVMEHPLPAFYIRHDDNAPEHSYHFTGAHITLHMTSFLTFQCIHPCTAYSMLHHKNIITYDNYDHVRTVASSHLPSLACLHIAGLRWQHCTASALSLVHQHDALHKIIWMATTESKARQQQR